MDFSFLWVNEDFFCCRRDYRLGSVITNLI
jgi:hypothetical protein